jgi:hypothetical protein
MKMLVNISAEIRKRCTQKLGVYPLHRYADLRCLEFTSYIDVQPSRMRYRGHGGKIQHIPCLHNQDMIKVQALDVRAHGKINNSMSLLYLFRHYR